MHFPVAEAQKPPQTKTDEQLSPSSPPPDSNNGLFWVFCFFLLLFI